MGQINYTESPNRRVLMIARAYPPHNGPGSARPAALAKWLPSFGWTPFVVAADFGGQALDPLHDEDFMPDARDSIVALIPTKKRPSLRALIRAFMEGNPVQPELKYIRSGPSLLGGSLARLWIEGVQGVLSDRMSPELIPRAFTKRALADVPAVAERYRPDVIWATSPPPGMHTVAATIAHRFSIPWVADYRDILEQRTQVGSGSSWVRRRRVCREASILQSASAIVTVSESLAAILEERLERSVSVITNGFEPGDFSSEGTCLDSKFTISYFGSMDLPHRDPRPLFRALDALFAAGNIDADHVRVMFYGPCEGQLRLALADGFACEACIRHAGTLSRRESHQCQQQSQVLLQLAHGSEKGVMTGKIFEYLGARRPILSIPADGDCVDALLRETSCGVPCSTVPEICDVLKRWYTEWRQTGAVSWRGNPHALQCYTREATAAQLASILDSVLESGSRPQRIVSVPA